MPVQVGYQRRFDAAFAAAKRAVDDGSLGALHTVRSTTMDPAPPPMDYIAGSGGIFRDCAVHDFDILRWITGQQAVEVYATGSVQGDPQFAEFGDVDTAAVVVRFDRAPSAWSRRPATTAAATTAGSRCTASTTPSSPAGIRARRCETSIPPTIFPEGPSHHFFMDRFTEAFRAELAAFVEVAKGNAAPGLHRRRRGRGRLARRGGDRVAEARCPGTTRRK